MKRIYFAILALVLIMLPVSRLNSQTLSENTFKFGRTLGLIDAYYVDTANLNLLTEKAIIEILKSLDPHSTFISAKDVKEMNEPLQGNFDGIGIQFNVLHDTIVVIEPVKNGPSEKVGLRAGDRIIKINDENVTNIKISTNGVRSRLMGPKGTKVNIVVLRKGEKELFPFTITRDKIPINSLDAAYMLNSETGYIKLNKFAATTEREFYDGLALFNNTKIKNLVIDLRGNPGGYMLAAVAVANQFLEGQKLVVYMQGRKTPREDFPSTGTGILKNMKLVVLTDEGSASASEILAGAMQDWDRGVVIGRRTFGKGLVQNGFSLNDGSQIRLTIARYYTPTGRSIQSPYAEGYDKYMENYVKRFSNGETLNADSIHFPDSLRYFTLVNRRSVYGGGGIMPDIFVPADTSFYTQYYGRLVNRGIFNSFTLEYADRNRKKILEEYRNFDNFKSRFELAGEDIDAFIRAGESAGVKFDEAQYAISKPYILKILKALVANDIWQTTEYFRIINEGDNVIEKALMILSNDQEYRRILGYKK